jgi:hypothetical protein
LLRITYEHSTRSIRSYRTTWHGRHQPCR